MSKSDTVLLVQLQDRDGTRRKQVASDTVTLSAQKRNSKKKNTTTKRETKTEK